MQIEFIMPAQVNEYLRRGAQFIDLRGRRDYEEKHIQNALSIPFEQFEERYLSLPRNKNYILYCERGSSSMLAARKMLAAGYQVRSLSGGIMALSRRKSYSEKD